MHYHEQAIFETTSNRMAGIFLKAIRHAAERLTCKGIKMPRASPFDDPFCTWRLACMCHKALGWKAIDDLQLLYSELNRRIDQAITQTP